MLGHSGVGKSTMVNALTGAERATGGVNAVTGRGRHTSSSALALKLADAPTGSWIIDTPGIRSFGLAHVDPDRILHSFPDLAPGTEACERGCKHDAVRRELRRGRLGGRPAMQDPPARPGLPPCAGCWAPIRAWKPRKRRNSAASAEPHGASGVRTSPPRRAFDGSLEP